MFTVKHGFTAKRIIFLAAAILWMSLIFAMSSRNGHESTSDSTGVGRLIARIMVPGFEELDAARQEEFALAIDGPVRKTAHGIEYAILSAMLLGVFYTGNIKGYVRAFILTAIYAASDEFHQLFVPGRSGMAKDVLIDSVGALIFLALFGILAGFLSKLKR